MRFADIPGNEEVKKAFVGMVDSGRIPHAIMLHENDGSGALPLTLAFLQYLYCSSKGKGDSCGECASCNKVSKLIHPDVHFVFPVTSGSKVSADEKPTSDTYIKQWRELVLSNPYFFESDLYAALGVEGKAGVIAVSEAKSILDKLSLTGVEGGFKAIVMYLPEKMNQEAANRLLKIVEEPPEMTLFIMITHEPSRVLTTISSRCLQIRVMPMSPDDAARVHPQLTDRTDHNEMMDIFSDLLKALLDNNLLSALEVGETIASLDSREKQKAFCRFAGDCLRKIFLLQQKMPQLADVTPQENEFFKMAATRCKKSFSRNAMSVLDRAGVLLDRNVNQKILFCEVVNRLYLIV